MTIIKQILRSRLIQMFVGMTILYWVVAAIFAQDDLNTVITGISVFLAGSVVVMYAPLAWRELFDPTLTSRGRLVWGIIFSWTTRLIFSVVAVITLLLDKALQFNITPLFGYIFTIVLFAAVLHVTAPIMDADIAPKRSWKTVIVAVGLGALLAGIVFGIGIATVITKG